MATLTTETWTGSNGAAWPAQWATGMNPAAGGGATIQGNTGRLQIGSNATPYFGNNRISRRITTNATDVVVTVKVRFTASTASFPRIYVRSTNTSLDSQGGYWIELDGDGDVWTVGEGGSYVNNALPNSAAGGSTTPIAQTFNTNTWYWVKFGAVGTAIKGKVWADGAGEPGSWQWESTDSTLSTSAPYGFSIGPGPTASVYVEFDDFTAADTFSSSVSGSVTGLVAASTATAPAGTAGGGASVTGLAAASTATAPAGTVTGGASVSGVAAASTATAPAGTLAYGYVVTGPVAASTASAPAGTAGVGATVAGPVATASATAPAGSLAYGYAVAGPAAASTASAPAGAVPTGATVQGVTATTTASAPAGSVANGFAVIGVAATVSAAAPPGSLAYGRVTTGVTATSTASATPGVPSGNLSGGAVVNGVTATVTCLAPAGSVAYGRAVAGVVATVETLARVGQVHAIAIGPPDYTVGVAKVVVYDDEYTPIGEIMEWRALSFLSELDDIGEWSLDVDLDSAAAELLGRVMNTGGGIRVQRNGVEEFSGPIWHRNRSMAANEADGVLSVGGPGNNWQLARRLVYPNPAVEVDDYTGASPLFYRVGPTNAESIYRDLVGKNAAVNATLATRRIPELTVAANANLGATFTSPKYRFTPLIEALQQLSPLSRTGGDRSTDLHFRVVVVDRGLQFQVFRATDRTATARFSFDRGTLESAEWTEAGHTANFAIAGAGNVEDVESKARVAAALFSKERTDAWYPGRTETFVDVGEVDPAEADADDQIDQQLSDALEAGAGSYGANITPRVGEYLQYGRDFALGDYVSVELPGLSFTAPVRQVAISYDAEGGEQIEISVGTADGAYSRLTPGIYRRYADLAKKLRKLKTIK